MVSSLLAPVVCVYLVLTIESRTELLSLVWAVHALVPDGVQLLSGGLTELLHVLLLEFIETTDLLTQLSRIGERDSTESDGACSCIVHTL